jgi:phage terminase large subunit-like protein
MKSSLFAVAGAKEAARIRGTETSKIPTLREFLVGAWENVLHPSEKLDLEGAWYIDLICEELTLLTIGTLRRLGETGVVDRLLAPFGIDDERLDQSLTETRKLLINIPPRCTKSTLANVCWPCWEWLVMPWMTDMCISYSQNLASEHNNDRRKIIESTWFKSLGRGITLSSSLNRITEFESNYLGKMVGRGLNAGVTGGGGIRLIFDDPNDPNKVESEVVRDKTGKSFRDYSSTRLNNPSLACVLVVQQRTHQKDVSGLILAEPEEWRVIIIQMESEREEVFRFPLSGRTVHRKVGDLMHPSRFPDSVIAGLKRLVDIWAGRYQQRPNAAGGTYFKFENWRLYAILPPVDRTMLSVDCTFDDTPGSDNVAMGVISQCSNVRTGIDATGNTIYESEYYLRHVEQKQRDFVETEAAIKLILAKFPSITTKLIENKANGPAIINRLSSTVPGLTAFRPGRSGKKERASAVSPIQHRKDILIPISDQYRPALIELGMNSISVADWWTIYPPTTTATAECIPVDPSFKEFLEDLALFPVGAHDDYVDMLTQSILWSEGNNLSDGWNGFGLTAI